MCQATIGLFPLWVLHLHLIITGQHIVNREKVSYHCVLSLLNLSSNIFTFCVKCSFYVFTSCCCSLIITKFYFLHQHPNYEKESAYLYDKDMQKSGVDHVISDMCMFLRRVVFHAQERFFDKNDTLAEFPQLCLYERFGI
jgi:hypothetical protein